MRLDTVYVIHHSHTDIGFTVDQPVFWELQHRFIRDALDIVDRQRDLGSASDCAFRWTVETACQAEAFLRSATARDVGRFVRAEKEGFIEVTAMFANLTPLADARQLRESLGTALSLRREYGFDIRHAMNCDVNGHNWILADLLLDAGIEAFSMAVNHHFGGPPEPRPEVFLWEAPSGRLLPTLNGWQYSKALDFGIGEPSFDKFRGWLPRMEAQLEANGVRVPFFALQGFHPFGDNGSAWEGYSDFIRRWNEAGERPRLVSATPRMFWDRVAAFRAGAAVGGAEDLPIRRGDWTDYWNFGCISAARETAVSRTSRERLVRADALLAALSLAEGPGAGALREGSDALARRTHALYRDEAWRELNLYAEHTWGGEEAALFPETEDSLATEIHKKAMAWKARSLSLLLERDALADLSRLVAREDPADYLVFNHLPWARSVCGPVARNLAMIRGLPEDSSASRHYLGRNEPPTDFWTGREARSFQGNFGLVLPPTELPAFGWATVRAADFEFMAQAEASAEFRVESGRYTLSFDPKSGGLGSIFDKSLGWELVDSGSGLPFHGFVHEEVADRERPEPRKAIFEMDWAPMAQTVRGWKPGWEARRSADCSLVSHSVYRLSFETIVEQVLEHPKVGRILRRIVIPMDTGPVSSGPVSSGWIEFQAEWEMGMGTHPEASYLAFPFDLPGAQARFDSGGVPVRPELDQLPGVNRDYFTAQLWADFNDGARGVALALPDNPMIQLGGFNFGRDQARFELERSLLLGWVTNNYWETNFPGRQPGTVVSRYAILPYAGAFDQGRNHRFASEFANSRPVLQPLGEKPSGADLPASASLLELPGAPFQLLSIRAEPSGGWLVLDILNSGDERAVARVGSGLARIRAAELVAPGPVRGAGAAGAELSKLSLSDGSVSITLDPFSFASIRLDARIPGPGEKP